jgi:hypothetical protein
MMTALSLYAGVQGAPGPDRVFTPQNSFVSSVNQGLGGAGCALPWDIDGAFINPALLYSCRNGAGGAVLIGYGRDSLFDQYSVPVGIGGFRRMSAMAGYFRALSSSSGLGEYEAAAAYCRRISGRADPLGPIDIGANLRFERADWSRNGFDTLSSVFTHVSQSGKDIGRDSTVRDGMPPESGSFDENRLFVDIGTFVPEIAGNIDCGLSIRDLVGFAWGRETPDTIRSSKIIDTVNDSVRVVRSSESYGSGFRRYAGMVSWQYAVVCFGLNYRISNPGSELYFSIPVDIDFYGLLDPKVNEATAIRFGVQAHFSKDFFLRIGFSHAPGLQYENFKSFSMVNNITFGATVLPQGLPAAIDCYFSGYNWGMNVGIDY